MNGCWYCECEPEPGFIRVENGGPIGGCPVCNAEYNSRREQEFELALAQRAQRAAQRVRGLDGDEQGI